MAGIPPHKLPINTNNPRNRQTRFFMVFVPKVKLFFRIPLACFSSATVQVMFGRHHGMAIETENAHQRG